MIRAVIFDMDGVILDSEKLYTRYWMEAARAFGFDWQFEHSLMVRSFAPEFAVPAFQKIFGESFDYYAVRSERKRRMNLYLEDHPIELKPGVHELLEFLKKHYYKTAIATATDDARTMKYLEQNDLLTYFDQIITTGSVPHGKPMPDVYRYACKQIGEKPQDCIALEDSPNGVLSASRAGCKVIMVPDLSEPDEELSKLLYGKAKSLTDVISLLA